MNATLSMPVVAQLLVNISDIYMLKDIKKAISMLKGVDSVKTQNAKPQKAKPSLYDPETGEFLSEETMKVIEDVRSGKEQCTSYSSFDEFEKAMRAL